MKPTHIIEEEQRIGFSGLNEHYSTTVPESIANSVDIPRKPDNSLKDIIKFLPDAQTEELKVTNSLVREDGTIDVKQARQILNDPSAPSSLETICEDLQQIDQADHLVDVNDHIAVVDNRRKLLNALGHECKYHWQVAKSYTVINPMDGYREALKTFDKNGDGDQVFGWADIRDYGGTIDLYILFKSRALYPGSRTEENDDAPLYLGIQTGYDFSGGRAFDSQLFGFDTEYNLWMFSLGPRNSRRHDGKLETIQEETNDWWENEYSRIELYTDEFVNEIVEAESLFIDFDERGYSVEEFYYLLGIPYNDRETGYATEAAKRARRKAGGNTVNIWTLGYSLLATLEDDYTAQENGTKYNSDTFRAYAEIATTIIRKPSQQIDKVESEIERQKHGNVSDSSQSVLGEKDPDDLAGIQSRTPTAIVEKSSTLKSTSQKLLKESYS